MVAFALLLIQDADAILRDLGADAYEVREAATEELLRLSPAAAALIIERALDSGDLEIRARAMRVRHLHDLAQRPPVKINDEIRYYGFGVSTATIRVIGRASERRQGWRAFFATGERP